VKSCSGEVAKSSGSFIYLGSLTVPKGSSGPEIRRRIKKAGEAFRSVWQLWKMKGIPLKLKGPLYSAFVHSAMLYNCEFWSINKSELEDLEAKNVYLMRKLVSNNAQDEEERLSGPQLWEMLDLESVEMMIRKKTLQWTAHCARRGESDLTWRRMRREIEDDQSQRGKRIKEYWKKMGVKSVKQWCVREGGRPRLAGK